MKVSSEGLLHTIIRTIEDKKGNDVVALDLQGISLIADYFVICHGNSDTQVKAIAEGVKEAAGKLGGEVRRIEGFDSARWVLIDLNDVVVHVFHRDERPYYNLERLWADARVVERV